MHHSLMGLAHLITSVHLCCQGRRELAIQFICCLERGNVCHFHRANDDYEASHTLQLEGCSEVVQTVYGGCEDT